MPIARRSLPFLLFALAGCEELTRAPVAAPFDLVGQTAEPGPAAVRAVAQAFGDGGVALGGQPAAVAQAAAQLEFLAAEVPNSPAWLPLPVFVGYELRNARTELRSALGIPAEAPSQPVITALLQAARSLRANDRRGAEAALAPGLFRPGGRLSLARLGEPGALPQCAIASNLALQELERLQREGFRSNGQVNEQSFGGPSLLGPNGGPNGELGPSY